MNCSTADLGNYWTEFHETWWSYRYMFLVGYDNNEIRTSDFLKHISNLYAPSIPAPNHEEVDTDTASDSD
jgi:hypothetical protein